MVIKNSWTAHSPLKQILCQKQKKMFTSAFDTNPAFFS